MPLVQGPEPLTLSVNADRLASALHESCQYGADHRYGKQPTETGMARLSLDDSDKAVRDWFLCRAESLGCSTSIDEMGNLFAIRSGKNSDAAPIMMGSHLDTQPTGGRYDGILGVLAGLEVLQVLDENKIETEGNVGVVNWTNEEGARFPKMAVSSGVWAGAVPLDDAWNLKEVTPHTGKAKTMLQELERIGYRGQAPASYKSNPFAAHFELHIEQGPILEDEGRKIGAVQGVQAFKWFSIAVRGRDCHAGTTPLYARKDSVLAAAKMIVAANAVAKAHDGLATTGMVHAEPGTVNTMAHTTTFTLDLRHGSDQVLAKMVDECRAAFQSAAQDTEKGCQVGWTLLVDSPAVVFDQDCISAVEDSAAAACAGLPGGASSERLWRRIVSGAGHDSCYTSLRCPTSMIFTPTRDGISHNPTEFCSAQDW
ncbi:hypothetical protein MY1884_005221 [Beauveria asiatica]